MGLTRPQFSLGRFRSYRFLGLLLALLLLLITTAFVENDLVDRAILSFLFATVLFAAGGAASTRPQERWCWLGWRWEAAPSSSSACCSSTRRSMSPGWRC